MFTAQDYRIISEIVFDTECKYPGYRPNVVESPNGDGYWDGDKRYAHIAYKYLDEYKEVLNERKCKSLGIPYYSKEELNKLRTLDSKTYYTYIEKYMSVLTDVSYMCTLRDYLTKANDKAIEVAIELGIPKEFWPDVRYGALRILEYPPGAVTNPHKDFDLFTLMCYRNIPENFNYIIEGTEDDPQIYKSDGTHDRLLTEAQKLNHQIHFGEILEMVMPIYKANMHEVVADPFKRTQYSIVYFSIPDHSIKLPTGETVKEWLDERLSRSRKEVEVK